MDHTTATALNYYPIKSCAGTSVESLDADTLGPTYDRRFMLVDQDGIFLSQRELPKLALVKPEIPTGKDDRGTLRVRVKNTENMEDTEDAESKDGHGLEALDVPLAPEGERRVVRIFGDLVEVSSVSREADGWFSEYLGLSCRLVYLPERSVRLIDPDYAKAGEHVTLADGFPFLVISEASLEDLNSRLEEPLPMNRFRPNIVVRGTEPYEEDTWTRIRIGELEFRVVKACARCAITTVDQTTAKKGKEPLTTLATYRSSPAGVLFGQNLIHKGPGTVRVGDTMEVL